jgi:hypothetical protein
VKARAEKEADADELPLAERLAQIFVVVGLIVVIAFVAIHQTRPTGFLTDEFGAVAAALLYGMLVIGITPAVVRFLVGRENPGRLFEAAGLAVCVVAELYLLATFPFDFEFFAEPLPYWMEFLLEWVPAVLAKFMLVLAVLLSAAFSVYGFMMYFAVKERLSEEGSGD